MPPPTANTTMRLLLLPISTRRSLVYCEPMALLNSNAKPSLVDRAVNKASTTWVEWEKDTKAPWQWKKRITAYGNVLFRRIPFEEWGLKTIPSIPKNSPDTGKAPVEKVELRYPRAFQGLCHFSLMDNLKKIATERQGLHRTRMRRSVYAMPFTIPVAILPVIPNLPFFYLVFRAYSHFKALRGSQHLEHLLKNDAITPKPSGVMDELYAAGLLHLSPEARRSAPQLTAEQAASVLAKMRQQVEEAKASSAVIKLHGNIEQSEADEVMLLRQWNGQLLAEKLGLPGLQVEIERAVEQVEASIRKTREANAENRKSKSQ